MKEKPYTEWSNSELLAEVEKYSVEPYNDARSGLSFTNSFVQVLAARLATAAAQVQEKNELLAELSSGLAELAQQVELVQSDRWNSLSVADRDRLIRDACK